MITTLSGVISAAIVIILIRLAPRQLPAKVVATTALCAMAFIYVGFSLQGNSLYSICVESAAAIVFYLIAIMGYTSNPLLLSYGILLHGIWDFTHHHSILLGTDIPDYWPSYCLTIDVIWAVYFYFHFKGQVKRGEWSDSLH